MATSNTFGTPNNTVGNLNGLFKEVYADKLANLIPDGVKVMKEIKFVPKDKQPGNLYHQPVILGMEHGITFAASDEDAFNLQPAVAGSIKDAQVRGNPALMRSILGYNAASRSLGSAQAFESATKYLVANMMRSMSKKLEIEMFYGTVGYGVVSAVAANVLTIATAEWAPGIWSGGEGMPIEIRSANGTTSRGTFTIVDVALDQYQLTLDSSAANAGVIATDVIWHKGAYGNEFPGIHAILSQLTGTLFNINVGQYSLFQGNQFDAGAGALTFNKLTLAAARAIEKGQDGALKCLINNRAWAGLLNNQAALRLYDSSYSPVEMENGSQKLRFFSQNGELVIEPSIYVKEGYAYMLSADDWSRVGSSDLTFRVPGQGDEFFRHLTDAAGYELRLWTDQAIFTHAPGHSIIISNIINPLS